MFKLLTNTGVIIFTGREGEALNEVDTWIEIAKYHTRTWDGERVLDTGNNPCNLWKLKFHGIFLQIDSML